MKKDWKRHIAFEVLVILVMLTVLMYLCRLWPIIFLLIIGIFITALRLLFLSPKRVEVVEPLHCRHYRNRKSLRKRMLEILLILSCSDGLPSLSLRPIRKPDGSGKHRMPDSS